MVLEPVSARSEEVFHPTLDTFKKSIPESDVRLNLAIRVDIPTLSSVGIGKRTRRDTGDRVVVVHETIVLPGQAADTFGCKRFVADTRWPNV